MEYSQEVRRLAETLKSSGLVASMVDSLERAQSMLGGKEESNEEIKKEKDAEQTTLDRINKPEEKDEAKEYSDAQEGLNKEDVFKNKPEAEQTGNEEKQEGLQKKADSSRIFNVNK